MCLQYQLMHPSLCRLPLRCGAGLRRHGHSTPQLKGLRYLHWIHTLYIFTCFPLFTWRRRSTKFWTFSKPAVENNKSNSSEEVRKEKEKHNQLDCWRQPSKIALFQHHSWETANICIALSMDQVIRTRTCSSPLKRRHPSGNSNVS